MTDMLPGVQGLSPRPSPVLRCWARTSTHDFCGGRGGGSESRHIGPGRSVQAAPSPPAACACLSPQHSCPAPLRDSGRLSLPTRPPETAASICPQRQGLTSGGCWRTALPNLSSKHPHAGSGSQAPGAPPPPTQGRARRSYSGKPPRGVEKCIVHISLLNYSSPSPGPALVSAPEGPGFMYFILILALRGARSWAANVDGSRYAPGLERGYMTASKASLAPRLASCQPVVCWG